MRTVFVIVTAGLLASGCKDDEGSAAEAQTAPEPEEPESPPEDPAGPESAPDESAEGGQIEKLEFNYDELKSSIEPTNLERKLSPELDVGLRWRDGAGEHFFAVRRLYGFEGKSINYAKLHMHLYSRPEGSEEYERARLLRDGQPYERCYCCEGGQANQLQEESLELTDIDSDGTAELTFAYYRPGFHGRRPEKIAGDREGFDRSSRLAAACALVQPLKLIVLEGTDKYILRGTAKIPGVPKSGEHRPDPPPGEWPEPFLAHARQRWERAASAERPSPPPPSAVERALEDHGDLVDLLY